MPNYGVIVMPQIPSQKGRYGYYVYPMDNFAQGLFIDVTDFTKIREFREKFNFGDEAPVSNVFLTQPPDDKEAFQNDLKNAFPNVRIYGGSKDESMGITHIIKDEEKIELFGDKI